MRYIFDCEIKDLEIKLDVRKDMEDVQQRSKEWATMWNFFKVEIKFGETELQFVLSYYPCAVTLVCQKRACL